MKKKYKINWLTVLRNLSVTSLIVSLTMATIQLVSIGGW